ncbi:uncharacterized protein LOC100212066 [Hydra vulgaris]|uniref:uncharacterized protein LOC100212066 n=1 Tax=Hydra vulgaris TaxID=6087 RepID=UPI0032E9CC5D
MRVFLDHINHEREIILTQGLVLGTLGVLKKEYTISFNLKPMSYSKGAKNVLYLTLTVNSEVYVDRNPGVWFHEDGSGRLVIYAAVSGNNNSSIITDSLTLGLWSNVKICQFLLYGKHWFSVDINGINVYRGENCFAADFKDMKVYVSSLWNNSQNGSLSDFLIINGKAEYIVESINTSLVKKRVVAEISKLDKEYLFSFNFYPIAFKSGLHSIIYFNIAANVINNGNDIVLGIWLDEYGRGRLKILALINRNLTSFYYPIKLNMWSIIELCQSFNGLFYLYTIRINGKVVFSNINNQVQSLDNIKVYASNPFDNAQYGLIKSFFLVNGNLHNEMESVYIPNKVYLDHINHGQEIFLTQGLYIGTLRILRKEYTISFNLKPMSYSKGVKSVFHLTSDDANNLYGSKGLVILFHEDGSGRLVINAAISGNSSYTVITNPLSLWVWSNIKICQWSLYGKYSFTIDINGVNIHQTENLLAVDFNRMKVYVSDIWDEAQNGTISDILVVNRKAEYIVKSINTPLVKGKFLAQIPKLDKEYLVSIDLNPIIFQYGLHNVIYFVVESNAFNNRSEILGIWLDENGKERLKIVALINKNLTSFYYPIEINMWSKIELSQGFNGFFYLYTIRMNGKLVFSSINNHVQSFDIVKVYASNSWDNVQKAIIKNFFVINGNLYDAADFIAIHPKDYINLSEEYALTGGLILGTLNVLKKEYTISFNLKPMNYSKGVQSVIHLTSDNVRNLYGNRNLGVWFHDDGSGRLVIYAAINVDINRVNIHRVENSLAANIEEMKVYASNKWDPPHNGFISELLIINGKAEYIVDNFVTPLAKGKMVAEIPVLDKEFFVSLDFNPFKFDFGSHNVIHFTIGSDHSNYGDKTPGIWSNAQGTGVLDIASSINGYLDVHTFSTDVFEINQWSNIVICQVFNGLFYIYKIRINEQTVFSIINNQAESFDNVKVYASNPWADVQNGSIKNLFVVNGNSTKEMKPIVINPKVPSHSLPGNNKALVFSILVPVLVVLLMVAIAVLKIQYKKFKKTPGPCAIECSTGCDNLAADEWEIFPEDLVLDKKIGEGAFGTVFIAKISSTALSKMKNTKQRSDFLAIKDNSGTNVAVKLVKDYADQSEINDFFEEMNLMKGIGYHKNIVNLIGCSTIKKPLCLIVEYMENGDLLNFLRKKRSKLCLSKRESSVRESSFMSKKEKKSFMYTQRYQQSLETTSNDNFCLSFMPNDIPLEEIEKEIEITPDDLLSFAWQVVSGMEYLSCSKLVHRDLAARNILVGTGRVVKISDFGLTRKINDELNYLSKKNRRLPVKWMSVEAIFDQMFTSYSDVWAFGVVLFEIVTLGGTPYPTISNRELLSLLKSGYRMDKPENCSEEMYNIMLQCWNEDPLQRPTFTTLREHFDGIISHGDSYFNFEIDSNTYHHAASFKSIPFETHYDTVVEDIFQKPVLLEQTNEINISKNAVSPLESRPANPESAKSQVKSISSTFDETTEC